MGATVSGSIVAGRFMRTLLLAGIVTLAGCASLPGNDVLQTVSATGVEATTVEIHAVSTRGRQDPGTNAFTDERIAERNYAHFTVSIPPTHQPGRIEWPRGRIDPATTFAVVDQRVGTQETFLDRVKSGPTAPADVVLFVHGYNQSFPQALYRLAQLAADSGLPDVPVLFAWPSQGSIAGYVADRESAAFSRDALAATLTDLADDRRIGSITVFAHSLGGWLTMEALRQMRLTGKDTALDRLAVVLAAPDIDVDLFERQLAVLKPMDQPLTVLVAPDDQALRASMEIGGSHQRVGLLDVEDPKVAELAREHDIAIVDISSIQSSDPLNHRRYAALASLAASVEDGDMPARGVRQAGAFVFNAVGATISSPFDLVGRALAGE